MTVMRLLRREYFLVKELKELDRNAKQYRRKSTGLGGAHFTGRGGARPLLPQKRNTAALPRQPNHRTLPMTGALPLTSRHIVRKEHRIYNRLEFIKFIAMGRHEKHTSLPKTCSSQLISGGSHAQRYFGKNQTKPHQCL